MDERKLEELFRSAVRDAPPASFDQADVAAEAVRITRRRRSLLASGGGLAVVVLAVGLFFGTGGFGHTQGGTSSAAGVASEPRSDSTGTNVAPKPFADQGPVRGMSGFPSESPMQGGVSNGRVGPSADSTPSGCGPTDEQLAVALANELSSVGAPAATPVSVACPPGTRSASYDVGAQRVTALLVPAANAGLVRTDGSATVTGPSTTGTWTVFVLGTPAAPAGVDLGTVQRGIATHF